MSPGGDNSAMSTSVAARRAPAARALTGYRPHWAKRLGTAPFLPMSRAEMDAARLGLRAT